MSLASAVATLTPGPETGIWFRAVDPRHLSTALATNHTVGARSRFSSGAMRLLYLAENPMVALFEVQSLFGSPLMPGGVVPHPRRPFVSLAIQVTLSAIVDLTDPIAQRTLATNAQELTGDWQGYAQRSAATSIKVPVGSAPTQDIGDAIYAAGSIEGFKTLSARVPYCASLIVFPDRLRPSSQVICSYTASDGSTETLALP